MTPRDGLSPTMREILRFCQAGQTAGSLRVRCSDIAAAVGVSQNTARRALENLQAAGHLKYRGAGGRGTVITLEYAHYGQTNTV